ncbi:adenylate/guanylate cyclase domain-containing protein [Neolewinella lacunae]|uniref:Adenylate/guanylate cyclase domain-containing protein n=1 Tax=Neolewinella lacunae TaxID=1517758 RepID=A0A923PMI9_9BACT|nr:adenylate/guanylate cyclase domain-containing protein [Neolewinella lacunae]MBC6994024.1 adenylate/guanylate cyclase domain-containing protein [Neolewinella lacunae]MDN3634694.1 adenylate/guanylate cyclase domain-containing protein [Neolewinella lacunae]
MRNLLLLTVFLSAVPLFGQSGRYTGQVKAIESLLQEGNYRIARAQSQALVESGEQAMLPIVTARGRYLLGRTLTENPAATARERVEGIRELRLAAQLFRKEKVGPPLDSILLRLQELTGSQSVEDASLATSVPRTPTVSADSIETASLGAIVALQNQEIAALTDSQVRQLVQLQQQQRELDELEFRNLNDSLLLLQQENLITAQRAEVQRERFRRNTLLGLGAVILVVLGGLYARFRANQRYQSNLEAKNAIIEAERNRSDELLLNILPAEVAEELKQQGSATARRYDSVTVLFADFQGFSTLAANLEPEALVGMLDEAFRAFDEIVREHQLEKIKTIGDAYMCAGGLPRPTENHAPRMVRAALAMQQYLATNPNFSARIGIHTGPVVAGVVGKDKFSYDIWGDTVNQAARLEAAGEIGRVAISSSTKALLGPGYSCVLAGTFEAKNIGPMRRYFVTSP